MDENNDEPLATEYELGEFSGALLAIIELELPTLNCAQAETLRDELRKLARELLGVGETDA